LPSGGGEASPAAPFVAGLCRAWSCAWQALSTHPTHPPLGGAYMFENRASRVMSDTGSPVGFFGGKRRAAGNASQSRFSTGRELEDNRREHTIVGELVGRRSRGNAQSRKSPPLTVLGGMRGRVTTVVSCGDLAGSGGCRWILLVRPIPKRTAWRPRCVPLTSSG
jgi:hypothetical protein